MIADNKPQTPEFEADDLFKAMRVCVLMLGKKTADKNGRTVARVGIPAEVIKKTADEAEMEIAYDADQKCFVFGVPVKKSRKRGIVTPRRKLILPGG